MGTDIGLTASGPESPIRNLTGSSRFVVDKFVDCKTSSGPGLKDGKMFTDTMKTGRFASRVTNYFS